MIITLDIETGPSRPHEEIGYNLEPVFHAPTVGPVSSDAIKWIPSPKFAPLPMHIPEVICWLKTYGTAGKLIFNMRVYDSVRMSEKKMLKALADDIKCASRLVTWNGRRFDMPLLNLRAMKCGVDWSFWTDLRHRFPTYKSPLFHYDMKDQIGDYATHHFSLGETAKLLGLPGKVGMCGGAVRAALDSGDRNSVIKYCCNDVFETYMIYLAWERSHLGRDNRQIAQAAIEWAREDLSLRGFYT